MKRRDNNICVAASNKMANEGKWDWVIEEDQVRIWMRYVDSKKSTAILFCLIIVITGIKEATVHVVTTLGASNVEYFLWRGIGKVNCTVVLHPMYQGYINTSVLAPDY
ncbi:hypothetical protein FQA39_LY00204 [Lamprigera yunnana]|nr:hypothetical protein FQA39_LY00204 [Lamprigera yunnana]